MITAAGQLDPDLLAARVVAIPGIGLVRERLGGTPAYLVGGAVRDLLLGRSSADIDVAIEGDAVAAAHMLGADPRTHLRFGTASVPIDHKGKGKGEGHRVDLASTRSETYPHPGALPVVEPAPLAADLARRDFTIHAMAIALAEPGRLIDPHGGLADLAAGRLRVLHERSFADDPTRALRAARYAARLGLGLEPETERLLREADLGAVSSERVETELRLAAVEPDPAAALRLAIGWGLLEADPAAAAAVRAVLATPGWDRVADPAAATLAAAAVRAGRFEAAADRARIDALVGVSPERPSVCVAAARGAGGVELACARALGAAWLDDYVRAWRSVRLEISGSDLLAEGLEPGPAIGAALGSALAAKLDGEVAGREDELDLALAVARARDPKGRSG